MGESFGKVGLGISVSHRPELLDSLHLDQEPQAMGLVFIKGLNIKDLESTEITYNFPMIVL
jgi:hypothetical protein